MWMFAEIVDGAGVVDVRAEGDVTAEGELQALIGKVTERFKAAHSGVVLPDGAAANDIERRVRSGAWGCGVPLLNPERA